jgi:hypothetical protein
MKFGFVALFSLSAMAAVQADIHDKIADEKRFVVFNSRRLTGECCKYNNRMSFRLECIASSAW